MPTFRVLTVDDDAAARKRLRDLLSLDAECELAGDCSNGAEAISGSGRADIMVVEVEMTDMDGFEVVRRMAGKTPLVIFTSRHAEYAARAFEARGFDYLIKPLAEARFHDSLRRAKAQIIRDRTTSFDPFESLLRRRHAPQRIAIRKNGRVIFVTIEENDWIEAADNYVCLHCGGETHVLRETIREMETQLDPARFVRVHRSAIVNIDRIKELQPVVPRRLSRDPSGWNRVDAEEESSREAGFAVAARIICRIAGLKPRGRLKPAPHFSNRDT